MAKERKKSPKHNYHRGANFERRCKAELEKHDYLVCRSAGSHGEFDLMALNDDCMEGLLVQCKTNGKISMDEMASLADWAEIYGCIPLLASLVGRKIAWRLIEGPDRDKLTKLTLKPYDI